MQRIRLYDPNRTPPNWTDVMSSTQFAVFHSDARSGGHRNPGNASNSAEDKPEAEQSSCLLFDTLDEAVAYCVAQQNVPRLRLDIYDKAGKSKEPLRTFVSKEHTQRSHAGRLYMGLAFLVSGLLLVAFDWIMHWEWIWPTAVGLKLVLAAVVFLLWWWIKRDRN